MPQLVMTQRSSTTGFDLTSEKIRALHHAINPGIFLLDADNLGQITVNAAAAVGVIVNDHKFRRDGLGYVEYAVCVCNYAEQEHLSKSWIPQSSIMTC